MLEKIEYAKYIPHLKTHSKQNELERVWELITKDSEWAVALRKRKIIRRESTFTCIVYSVSHPKES